MCAGRCQTACRSGACCAEPSVAAPRSCGRPCGCLEPLDKLRVLVQRVARVSAAQGGACVCMVWVRACMAALALLSEACRRRLACAAAAATQVVQNPMHQTYVRSAAVLPLPFLAAALAPASSSCFTSAGRP